jgi:hypothetical protein
LALAATVIVGFGARAALASGTPREQASPGTAPVVADTTATSPTIAGTTVRVAVTPLNSSAPGWMLLCAMLCSCSAATWRITRKPSASAPSTWRSSSASRSPNRGSSTEATPAVVRPSTGDVFVFDGWATAEAPMAGRMRNPVPGAIAPATPNGTCDVGPVVDVAGARSAVALDGEGDR